MVQGFKQKFVFIAMMSFVMVFVMSQYFSMLEAGGFSSDAFMTGLARFVPAWLFAFAVESAALLALAKFLASRLLRSDSRLMTRILVTSFCMVCCMCPTMTMFGAVMQTGFNLSVFDCFLGMLPFTFPAALLLQWCFAGPTVRWVHARLFPAE